MAYHYVVTPHKATAVAACVTGNFISPNDVNLIVAKNSRLEIYLIAAEGLRLVKEVVLHGKVSVMKMFKPQHEKKDLLFILTMRYDAMVLECVSDGENLEIITKAHGNVSDRNHNHSEFGIVAIIDPEVQVIGLRLYDGIFKIIPLDRDNSELEASNIIMDELQVMDVEFLHGCANPTIVLIHQDLNGRHVKTHEIFLGAKEFVKMPWRQDNVEPEASMIIPVPSPLYGAIIIGHESILYHNGIISVTVKPPVIKQSTIVCYTMVDSGGLRYLLGDKAGRLFMLFLENESRGDGAVVVTDLKVELLGGEISIPECITYLNNGLLYIGSRLGDSQLVKLNTEIDKNSSYVAVMESFTSLAPIIDMCVLDLENQDLGQLVTCSGAFKDGSLRIINEIEIHQQASIDLPGIKDMWALTVGSDGKHDNILVLAFIGQTLVLSLNGEEVEETEIVGFASDQQTFYCGNVAHEQIIQVTSISARLVSAQSKNLLSEWRPRTEKNISVVACNTEQIVVSTGSELYYIEIHPNELIIKGHVVLDVEIACLDISPLGENATSAEFVAVGLWKVSACILRLPDLVETYKENLGEIIPRSVLMACFEGHNYLLCALGDGSMFYFSLQKDSGTLAEKKKVTLSRQPIVLRIFKSLSTTNVFVCSDRATVIHSSNHKLVFSNVNMKEVNHMCSLNAEAYPDSLALATDNCVTIATIDEIQKLNIRTVALQESPKRIAYQEQSETFGVLSVRVDIQGITGLNPSRSSASTMAQSVTVSSDVGGVGFLSLGQEIQVHNFLIMDRYSLGVLHAYQLMQQENAMSLISCQLGDDPNTYYVVGTAITDPENAESKQGRLLIFQWTYGELILISEKKLDGGCFCLAESNGKLIANINNTVTLFKWTAEKELCLQCSWRYGTIALYVKTKGDSVLVGHLMSSMNLLQYNGTENIFELSLKDYDFNWMTAVEILDDDLFLGSDNSLNMFVCVKGSAATKDKQQRQMQKVGQFHVGDMINVFRHATLVMENLGKISTPISGCVLFGTVDGAIGLVTRISPDFYELFSNVQSKLSTVIKSVGKLEHSYWRSFHTDSKTEPCEEFIDGDLIESFLDLSSDKMKEATEGLELIGEGGMKQDCKVDDVIEVVKQFKDTLVL